MDALIGLFVYFIIVIFLVLIIGIIFSIIKKSQPSKDLERRVEKLEEENRILRGNINN